MRPKRTPITDSKPWSWSWTTNAYARDSTLAHSRLKPLGQVDDRSLDSDRDTCNIITKYSPDYVKSRVLRGPGDALLCMVRSHAVN